MPAAVPESTEMNKDTVLGLKVHHGLEERGKDIEANKYIKLCQKSVWNPRKSKWKATSQRFRGAGVSMWKELG